MIVGLVLMAGVVHWGKRQWQGEGPLTQAVCLTVTAADVNLSRFAERLADDGIVSSGGIFRTGMEYRGGTSDLKAGRFLIREGASMADVVATVTGTGRSTCGNEVLYRVGVRGTDVQGRVMDPVSQRYEVVAAIGLGEEPSAVLAGLESESDTSFRMVVAEGVTAWQVVQALNDIAILDGEIAEIPAEGTLAPRDYVLERGKKVGDVLAEMKAVQAERLAAAWAGRSEGLSLRTPQEALIMASIVEKETALASERETVSAVFNNRLKRGMRLQTDPTVIYGITRGQSVLDRGLRRSELNKVTPWNTYVIPALPPTPIALPGEAALRAAVNPDDSEYLFFVADGTGGHAFASTLREHNANVQKWRAIEAERSSN